MPANQAVLLIHGIGEQKPMDTLRGFVEAVWTCDKSIHHKYAGGGLWSKPDTVSNSFELRRLTTPQNVAEIRTDFFEFYWAHMMKGTTYGHVIAWARSLLIRWPSTVPAHLRSAYGVLWIVAAAAIAFAVHAALPGHKSPWPDWVSALVSVLLVPLFGFVLRSVVGDAARYLHVAPPNIQSRHEIRQAGVELLKALHDRGYDRIVVVGHSLGSVIGYDILTHAWVKHHMVRRDDVDDGLPMVALEALEEMARNGAPPEALHAAQRAYYEEAKANGNTWRVTDFLTLGCPLAHAQILLARNADDLRQKQRDREFPTCLPELETSVRHDKEVKRFSFPANPRKPDGYRVAHHAAVFGATRWTNLYIPAFAMLWGDMIGGPLAEVMGKGVRDVEVGTSQRFGLFGHTLYWRPSDAEPAPEHIEALRKALDLTDD